MAVLVFVAMVVVGFLLLLAGCADVLRCVALSRGLFVRFSSNQHHDLARALPQLPNLTKRWEKVQKHDLEPLVRVPNDAN